MFKIKNEKAKLIIGEIFSRIEFVEVRGDSVEHLYYIKTGLKQIFDSLEEIKEEKPKEENKIKEGG